MELFKNLFGAEKIWALLRFEDSVAWFWHYWSELKNAQFYWIRNVQRPHNTR